MPALAELIASALSGQLDGGQLRQRLEAEPALLALRRALSGAEVRVGTGQVSFGSDNQFGDITFRDIVAGDQYNVTINLGQALQRPPDLLAEALALLGRLPAGDDEPIPPADAFQVTAVPRRIELLPNELFTGRDDDLRKLAAELKAGQGAIITTGMGGVGKTQLAVEFAHRYGRYFAGGVFWLNCADPGALEREVAAGGGSGGLDLPGFGELTLDEQVRRVRRAWASPMPRLLVFDNCEDAAALLRHRPPPGGCRLIVTSRRQQWGQGQGLAIHELDVLDRPASVTLLRRLCPRLAAAQAKQIAETLGDLPLALHLAGSLLESSSKPAEAFLADVERRRLEHPALRGRPGTHVPTLSKLGREIGLYAVLTLGLEQLDPATDTGRLARTLLARAACLEPAARPSRAICSS